MNKIQILHDLKRIAERFNEISEDVNKLKGELDMLHKHLEGNGNEGKTG